MIKLVAKTSGAKDGVLECRGIESDGRIRVLEIVTAYLIIRENDSVL